MIDFGILGPISVERDGVSIVPEGVKLRSLLALLLCRAGEPIGADALMDALWPDGLPPTAPKTLQVYVHRLRGLLGDKDRILFRAGGYRIHVDAAEVDAMRFDDLARKGLRAVRVGDTEQASDFLHRALAQWRGTPYQDVPSGVVPPEEIHRLEERRLIVHEHCLDADLDLGRHVEAVPELYSLIAAHPYRERLRAQLMVALTRMGRQRDALAVYGDTRRLLVDELGMEPGPSLRHLHVAVLQGDPRLGHAAISALVDEQGFLVQESGVDIKIAQLPPTVSAFTGRDEDHDHILELLRHREPLALPVIAISGPAGVGKTTLAVHVSHLIRADYPDGQLYTDLRGVTPDPRTAFEVLGHFLGALGVDGAALPEHLDGRIALYRSRIADRRMLVVLDNAASEEQVNPLLPGTGVSATLVTSRPSLGGLETSMSIELVGLDPDEALELFWKISTGR